MNQKSVTPPLRILVIDDEPGWCSTIGAYAELLGHDWQGATSFEQVKTDLQKAVQEGVPFSVATIDMKFEVGKRRTEVSLGTGILEYIKSNHPHIACIMVTGFPEPAHRSIELRDDHDLDYYISKDRLDLDSFATAIARALDRVQAPQNEGDAMIDSATWMSILAGAVTVLYTEIGALLKERRQARQLELQDKAAQVQEATGEEKAPTPSGQEPLHNEAEVKAALEQIDLQPFQVEIDRLGTLQELIAQSHRSLNDYEIEAKKPGLSISDRVGVRQLMEDTKTDIMTYGLELQELLEKISGQKIQL